ncbi:MAG: serine/threonine protein phosphatase [Pelagimonas sp.]|jgi:serine/threonine protein phosphatase 1|nr:serine/threonine protein phosphatase [Pelagimonas sp.]
MRWFKKPPPPRKAEGSEPFNAEVLPDEDFFVIGDIHGSVEVVRILLERIQLITAKPKIIFVGDYVDRGEHSAQVLRGLMRLTTHAPDRLICLIGNHEEMLLSFLRDPKATGDRWLRHGGLQTLASYGISTGQSRDLEEVRDELIENMGQPLIAWLKQRPYQWCSGNVHVVHAGADPDVPMRDQSKDVMTWGHPKFRRKPRTDGQWVVHGHTIVDIPQVAQGRISVDTGAYATGCLTAAHITTGNVTFLNSKT